MTSGTSHGPADYKIAIKGRLGDDWSDWFSGLSIESDGDMTLLIGRQIDQSALHGVLVRIRDLGLPLIFVERIQPDASDFHCAAATRHGGPI